VICVYVFACGASHYGYVEYVIQMYVVTIHNLYLSLHIQESAPTN
jgi:hypothetical protein